MRFESVNRMPHIGAEPAWGGGSMLARGYAKPRRTNGLPACENKRLSYWSNVSMATSNILICFREVHPDKKAGRFPLRVICRSDQEPAPGTYRETSSKAWRHNASLLVFRSQVQKGKKWNLVGLHITFAEITDTMSSKQKSHYEWESASLLNLSPFH